MKKKNSKNEKAEETSKGKKANKNKKENLSKENNNAKKEQNELKKPFFKKLWYSIDKIEKYSELSAEGFRSAMKYALILILIIAAVAGLTSVYKNIQRINDMAKFINDKAPEFTYKDSTLTVDSQEVIDENDETYGKIIIDTNTTDEEQINKYTEEINNEESGVIILKDKMILKQSGETTLENYNYKDLFAELGVTEFNKEDLVKYLTGNQMYNVYLNLFFTLFVYAIIIYAINAFAYILLVSIIGYVTSSALRLKIRYVAIFNMAVYAVTLPTLLNMVYIVANTIWSYQINYFGVMYVLIASIYIIAAIFMLKAEFNKKQSEVQKVVEVEKEVKAEAEEKLEKEKKEEKDKAKDKEKNEDKKEEKNPELNQNGEEQKQNQDKEKGKNKKQKQKANQEKEQEQNQELNGEKGVCDG